MGKQIILGYIVVSLPLITVCKAHRTLYDFAEIHRSKDLKTGSVTSQPCQSLVLRLDLKPSRKDLTCRILATGRRSTARQNVRKPWHWQSTHAPVFRLGEIARIVCGVQSYDWSQDPAGLKTLRPV